MTSWSPEGIWAGKTTWLKGKFLCIHTVENKHWIPVWMWNKRVDKIVKSGFAFFPAAKTSYPLLERQDMLRLRWVLSLQNWVQFANWLLTFLPHVKLLHFFLNSLYFIAATPQWYHIWKAYLCTHSISINISHVWDLLWGCNSLWNSAIINHCLQEALSYRCFPLWWVIPTETGWPTWSSAVSLIDRSYAPGGLHRLKTKKISYSNQNRDNLYCD